MLTQTFTGPGGVPAASATVPAVERRVAAAITNRPAASIPIEKPGQRIGQRHDFSYQNWPKVNTSNFPYATATTLGDYKTWMAEHPWGVGAIGVGLGLLFGGGLGAIFGRKSC